MGNNCFNCIYSKTEDEGYLRCFNKWSDEFGGYVNSCNLCNKFEKAKEIEIAEVNIKVVENGEDRNRSL